MKPRQISLALLSLAALIAATVFTGCKQREQKEETALDRMNLNLDDLVNHNPAIIGVAVIAPDDSVFTRTNATDTTRFQLMSVFKLHQALAVAATLDARGTGFDTLINISAAELDPDTWSPIVKRYGRTDITLSVDSLLSYLLIHSDNNASNILFDRIVSVEATDSIVKALTGIKDFNLSYTERQMHADTTLANGNWSTPLACARLIRSVMTDSLVSAPKQKRIRRYLRQCTTGAERILGATRRPIGLKVAHRTGTGFTRPDSSISAVNDVAHITLLDGTNVTIAILMSDVHMRPALADSNLRWIASAILGYYEDLHRK